MEILFVCLFSMGELTLVLVLHYMVHHLSPMRHSTFTLQASGLNSDLLLRSDFFVCLLSC